MTPEQPAEWLVWRRHRAARMTAAQLFAVTAVMEVGAGLALLVAPVLVISLLFVTSEIQTAVAIGRLAGAALISLGAACWWARQSSRQEREPLPRRCRSTG